MSTPNWMHDDFLFEAEMKKLKVPDYCWLKFPQNIVNDCLDEWLRLPRVKKGFVRIVEPDGNVWGDVPMRQVETCLSAFNEPHRFFRRDEWRTFLVQHLVEQTLRELDCSPQNGKSASVCSTDAPESRAKGG